MAQPRTVNEALDAIVLHHAVVHNPDRVNVGSVRHNGVLYVYSYGTHWFMGAYSEAAQCWFMRQPSERTSVTTTRHTGQLLSRVSRYAYTVVDGAVLHMAFKRGDPLLPAKESDVLRMVLAKEPFSVALERRGLYGSYSTAADVYHVGNWAGPTMAVWLEELGGEWWGRRDTYDPLLGRMPIAKWVDGNTLCSLRLVGFTAAAKLRLT